MKRTLKAILLAGSLGIVGTASIMPADAGVSVDVGIPGVVLQPGVTCYDEWNHPYYCEPNTPEYNNGFIWFTDNYGRRWWQRRYDGFRSRYFWNHEHNDWDRDHDHRWDHDHR